MLIMPASKRPYPALAAEAVEAFARGGLPLSRCVADVAAREEMSPEEVRRLTEQANTAAVVRMLRTSADKKAVFDLARPQDVLALTHPAEDDAPADPPVYKGLPEDKPLAKAASLAGLFGLSPQEKTAEGPPGADKRDLLGEWRRLCKQAGDATRRKAALETALHNGIGRLGLTFRRRSPAAFAKFATEALCLFPDAARPVVEGLASYLGWTIPLEKAAGIVDDRGEELRLMAAVCAGLEKWGACADEAARLERAAEAAWKSVLRREKTGREAAC